MTTSPSIVVIDYESGNLRSVAKALETTGVSPTVTGDPAALSAADAVILPGVGSGPAAMEALRQRGLVEPLRDFAASGKPFLGICLGLQLLLDHTEEGDAPCLGIVPGTVKRLPPGLKVPHMGWNSVDLRAGHPMLAGITQGNYFYFVTATTPLLPMKPEWPASPSTRCPFAAFTPGKIWWQPSFTRRRAAMRGCACTGISLTGPPHPLRIHRIAGGLTPELSPQ